MVNPDEFIKRLEIILEYYSLNASSFADKIGAQRSSMSHLLSGRNKPSLDFILKILEEFPEIDLYWLLIGTGNFPKTETKVELNIEPSTPLKTASTEAPKTVGQLDAFSDLNLETINKLEEKEVPTDQIKAIKTVDPIISEIERIVIFYTNGSFKTYSPT